MSRHSQGDSYVNSGAATTVLQRKATAAIVNVARVIAPVVYHFVIAVWRAKRQNPRTVTPRKTIIAILATLSASLTFGEDFKTINGKEYKDATVSRVEADGIVLRTKTGISKVYFVELPKDVQEKFHYGPAKPIPAQRDREMTQDEPRQANGGGKVVVVGQSVGSLKVIGAGIGVLLIVLLAVLRNRSRKSKSSN